MNNRTDDSNNKQALGKIEVMTREEFQEEIARKNLNRNYAQEARYREMAANHRKYVFLKWAFRVVSAVLLVLMWKTVVVPMLPILKPFFADLFGAQNGPDVSLSLSEGLYVNGYSAEFLRNTIFACFLKFMVYSSIFVIVRKFKRAAYKALVG